MPIYTYRNNWERTNLRVKLDNDWKNTAPYVYVNGAWKKALKPVPPGLIIPYNGTTAPAGWSLFTAADGKFVVGAGGTYAVGATGGTTSLTTIESTVQGVHTSTTGACSYNYSPAVSGTKPAGAHSHTLTYTYVPPYYGLRLIKAGSGLTTLPTNAVMFADTSMPGLSRFSSGDGKLFSARASIGAGGNNTINSFTSSSSGSHAHGTSNGSALGDYVFRNVSASGSHTHPSATFTITPNLYRALLSAWTNVSNAFALQSGMYAFYESTTPPEGWYLCDGSNGTLDLRNYFIEYATENNQGTRTGNGSISVPSITLSSITNTHNHISGNGKSQDESYHRNYNNTHSHTIPPSNPTFLPPYYALAIITLKS